MFACVCVCVSACRDDSTTTSADDDAKAKEERKFEPDRVTKFFTHEFSDAILNPKVRAVIFVLYFCWMIPAFIFALNLKASSRAHAAHNP